jgi:hypothetical protein
LSSPPFPSQSSPPLCRTHSHVLARRGSALPNPCLVLTEGAGAFRPLNTGHKGGPSGPGFLFRRHNRTVSAPSSAQAFPSQTSDPKYPHKFVIPTAAQRSGGICCLSGPAIIPRVATITTRAFEQLPHPSQSWAEAHDENAAGVWKDMIAAWESSGQQREFGKR